MKRLIIIFLLLLPFLGNSQTFTALKLRQTPYSPYTNLGRTLTWGELDYNFINLGDAVRNLQATAGSGSITATPPLTFSTSVMGIQLATTSQNGYLSSTDWNTFNGKQSALGFTAANDANVVHKTGAETINGIKTFGDSL